MFVRIARDCEPKGMHETTYECDSVAKHPLICEGRAIDDKFDLALEGPRGRSVVIQIDTKEAVSIYFMNSDGRTFDTMNFAGLET